MAVKEYLSTQRSCTTCPYCGVGCGVTINKEKRQSTSVISVTGDKQHPSNFGRLCVKGSALGETLGEHGRLLRPHLHGEACDWDTAMSYVADEFARNIHEHGPNSVAFYLSGQLLTEDYYVANKLMKGFIGSANIDTNSRLCMSSAVAGYKRALGADAVPCCYEDLEEADLIVLIGSNAAWTHPILFQRMQAGKAKIVVVDPRASATSEMADLHLAINPGSDAALFNGLLNFLAQHNRLNHHYIQHHTQGFELALEAAQHWSLQQTALSCGVPAEKLLAFFRLFAETEKTLSFYSQGVNQSSSGTDKNNTIINCHLATGRIGQIGAGPFSITGQPNAMGGREVGGLANMLAAHMEFKESDIDRVRRFWDAPNMALAPGLKAVDMFHAVETGQIKAIWIMATNPAVSMPEAERVTEALRKCPLVIVSDCIADTDTARCADVLLPATGWGEKNGTVTNAERRISRQRTFIDPTGEARHDWQAICDLASRLGFREQFNFTHPADIFREHAQLSGFENNGSRAFDISLFSNIAQNEYDTLEPVQWPVNRENPQGSARLFGNGKFFTETGRANFIAVKPRTPQQQISPSYPLWLNSGRIRDQWHTMTRTGRARKLLDHSEIAEIQINPRDARKYGIDEGVLVELHSAQGKMCGRAVLNSGQKPGELFAPIHWSQTLAQESKVSALAGAEVDPISGQPEFKQVPVQLKALACKSFITLICPEPLAQNLWRWLQTHMEENLLHWYRVPCQNGYRFELALSAPLDGRQLGAQLLQKNPDIRWQQIETLNSQRWLAYSEQIELLIFSSNDWQTLPDRRSLERYLQLELLENPAQFLQAIPPGERIVCTCMQVSRPQIEKAINQGVNSIDALGDALGCGTRCGSCKPEISQLLRTKLQQNAQNQAVAAVLETEIVRSAKDLREKFDKAYSA
ncbi:molybdopterin-dependent oxidoreductase [Microbulbifer variabilis]|uniref:Molybdopterin-dependent oxidoreductase n=1 Tax=Microbulbifer variabilis TaxID=266805 RepID=A0ABY4V9F5_9GAMM|nr:nitrate reductase [Microbulbifer variabilis]USD20802.1 molybdopterin-dependent oxidoreductase [Microbulbifer variabilis]